MAVGGLDMATLRGLWDHVKHLAPGADLGDRTEASLRRLVMEQTVSELRGGSLTAASFLCCVVQSGTGNIKLCH